MEKDGYDSDVCILEEEEVQPHLPAESPAEQEEENLFGCRGRNIFAQDDPPAPYPQSSLYGISRLIRDINLPTPEDPEVIPHSPRTRPALQSASIDLFAEVEQEAPLSPALEEVVDV